MKDVAKNLSKKLFTKEDKNIIINEKYNPLKVNYRLIYEREGLCVNNNQKNSVVKNGMKVDEVVLKCCLNICKYYNKDLKIRRKLGENNFKFYDF